MSPVEAAKKSSVVENHRVVVTDDVEVVTGNVVVETREVVEVDVDEGSV